MKKKVEAAILKSLHLHNKVEVLRKLVVEEGHYLAHYRLHGENKCRNSCGAVADEHHPLRGWIDYTCPHCGKPVRTVFDPSSGGGITRCWGLDLPEGGKVKVKIGPNSLEKARCGVQYDVLDLGGSWLVDLHPGAYALINLIEKTTFYDALEERCGGYEFEAVVTDAIMRTLIIVPTSMLPPKGWKAAYRIYGHPPDILKPYPGEIYVVPLKGKNFLLLFDRPPVFLPFHLPEDLVEMVKEARRYSIGFGLWYSRECPIDPPAYVEAEKRPRYGFLEVLATSRGWIIKINGCYAPGEDKEIIEGLGLYKPISTWWKAEVLASEYSEAAFIEALRKAIEIALDTVKRLTLRELH
jgi:hypothetical protein